MTAATPPARLPSESPSLAARSTPLFLLRNQWAAGLLLGLAALLTAIGPAHGQAPPTPAAPAAPVGNTAEAYIQLVEQRAELTAEKQFLDKELARLSEGRASADFSNHLFQDSPITDPEVRRLFSILVERNTEPLMSQIDQVIADNTSSRTKLRTQWQTLRKQLNDGRTELYRVGAGSQVGGLLASLLDPENRWVWFAGMVAVMSIILLYLHERRHNLRRMVLVRKNRFYGMAIMLFFFFMIPFIPTVLTFVFGDRLFNSVLEMSTSSGENPEVAIARQIETEKTAITALEAELVPLRTKHEQARDAWLKKLAGNLPEGAQLPTRWQEYRDQLAAVLKGYAAEGALAQGIKQDLTELDTVNAERGRQSAQIASYAWIKRMTGGGLGLVLLVLTLVAGGLFFRAISKRNRRMKATCPRCLAEGTLQVEESQDDSGKRELVCTNVIAEKPIREECEFRFALPYADQVKKSFATLGVSSSGKTHWLTRLYSELRHGSYKQGVVFERINSSGAEAFDKIVDLLLNQRINVSATNNALLPHPLIFNFRDNDKFGNSWLMLNTFDYAGAITAQRGLENFHRRRALSSDGFFFFLDPLRPRIDQSDALDRFREDLKIVRNLRNGQQIHSPVALCFTKVDLLSNPDLVPSIGEDLANAMYEELAEIDNDPKTPPLSLANIEKRSEVARRYMEIIWPKWDIEEQIKHVFGPRFMYFPMTPVGLEGNLGQTHVGDQQGSEPYGIVEPLLWLLHMNGYPVLK